VRSTLRITLLLSLLAAAVVVAQGALPTMDTGLVSSPKEAKFVPAKTPHSEGVQQAPIAADPPPGGSTGYARYVPGAGIPEHWHSATEYSTVLSGSMRLKLAGKTYELGPGSYWVAPPKTPHRLVCVGPGECLTQSRRAGPVDYNFVE